MNPNKDLIPLIKAAVDQDWRVGRTKSGHLSFVSPDGIRIYGSASPSDHRAILNIRAKLRRAGLII